MPTPQEEAASGGPAAGADLKSHAAASSNTGQHHAPSLEFQRTGTEIPAAVYRAVVLAYAWILATAWLDFSHSVETAWLASVAVIVGLVFFGIPVVLRHTNHALSRTRQRDFGEFLRSDIDTATGRLPGWEACLQIMIIPLCLALAAMALGSIWLWVS
jgi:hypothetical protein